MTETQIAPKTHRRQWFSWILILLGAALIIWGAYTPIKNQLILMRHQPPPAPPVSASGGDFIVPEGSGNTLADNPLVVVERPTRTPTPTATPIPTDTPVPAPEDPALPTAPPAPTATLSPTPTPNPFPPAQSPPTQIVAPSIGLDSPVVENGWHQETVGGQTVSVWDVAEYAAGWHINSALPGEPGNVVLSGHHNIKGEVFRYIVDLNIGDTITLVADGRPYEYKVTDNFIVKDRGEPPEVRRQNAQWIGQNFDGQRLTLVTCWPYTDNSHRVIVIAEPVIPSIES